MQWRINCFVKNTKILSTSAIDTFSFRQNLSLMHGLMGIIINLSNSLSTFLYNLTLNKCLALTLIFLLARPSQDVILLTLITWIEKGGNSSILLVTLLYDLCDSLAIWTLKCANLMINLWQQVSYFVPLTFLKHKIQNFLITNDTTGK